MTSNTLGARVLFNALFALLSVFILASCNQKVEPPNLVEAKFQCLDQPVKPGADAIITGTIKNTGGQFKGIKITLKGTAVSETVVSMPVSSRCFLENRFASQEKLLMDKANPSFMQVEPGTLECDLKDFEAKGDIIALTLSMPAQRQGKGDLHIIVTPLEYPDKAVTTWLTIEVRKLSGILMGH